MARKKISELQDLLGADGVLGDYFPIVKASVPETRKISISQFFQIPFIVSRILEIADAPDPGHMNSFDEVESLPSSPGPGPTLDNEVYSHLVTTSGSASQEEVILDSTGVVNGQRKLITLVTEGDPADELVVFCENGEPVGGPIILKGEGSFVLLEYRPSYTIQGNAGGWFAIMSYIADDNIFFEYPFDRFREFEMVITSVGGGVVKSSSPDEDEAVGRLEEERWLRIRYRFASTAVGTHGSGAYLFAIPSLFNIDPSRAIIDNTKFRGCLGHGFVCGDPSGEDPVNLEVKVAAYDETHLWLWYSDPEAAIAGEQQVGAGTKPFVVDGGIYFEALVPIIQDT